MKAIAAIILAVACSSVLADNYVQPYIKKDRTYVEGHYRSNPDRNPYNNYSSQGNYNPNTGRQGERDPYQVQQQYKPQPSYNSYPSGNYGNNRQRSNW